MRAGARGAELALLNRNERQTGVLLVELGGCDKESGANGRLGS